MNAPTATRPSVSSSSSTEPEVLLSGVQAASILGITYRRLDHHLRTLGTRDGLSTPGTGNPRSLREDDLFAIAMVAMIRENVDGRSLDFETVIPSLYEAFDAHDARVVIATDDPAVSLVVDGNDLRAHLSEEVAAFAHQRTTAQ